MKAEISFDLFLFWQRVSQIKNRNHIKKIEFGVLTK